MKEKRIYKYGTGDVIPEGAVYLTTIKQTKFEEDGNGGWRKHWLVWHYFLIEEETKKNE